MIRRTAIGLWGVLGITAWMGQACRPAEWSETTSDCHFESHVKNGFALTRNNGLLLGAFAEMEPAGELSPSITFKRGILLDTQIFEDMKTRQESLAVHPIDDQGRLGKKIMDLSHARAEVLAGSQPQKRSKDFPKCLVVDLAKYSYEK